MGSTTKEKNARYIKALNNAYLNHQLVIFYGAGVSKPLGLPDWGGLIDSILDQLMEEEYNSTNEHREKIKQEMNERDFWDGMNYLLNELEIDSQDLKRTIVEIISESELLNCPSDQQWEDNNYEDLAKMDVGLFITTNYDKIFPKCLGGHCETIDFIKNEKSLSDKLNTVGDNKKIIYLHGIVDEPSSIVISETDVERVYGSESWAEAFSTVLNSSKVLFIGVSFSDKHLSKFLKKRTCLNPESFYAIMLDKIDEEIFPGNQILIDAKNNNPVLLIRDILERIGREIENIVYIRVPQFDLKHKDEVQKRLFNTINNSYKIRFSCVDKYILISFFSYKKNQSLKEICNRIKKVIEELAEDEILDNNQFVCFISQNTQEVGRQTGALSSVYIKDQTIFMTKLISEDSRGFIIDKISLGLSKVEDKEWIQRFVEKKGKISEKNREYSVYVEEGIKIFDSHNSGTEVHVAGFVFYDERLVLEKRKSSEASVPDKYSLPGGRLKKGEMFRDALKRILAEKYKMIVDNMIIIGEFKVHDANIPGLTFGGHTHDIPKSFSFELFDQKKLRELKDDQLACSRDLINHAFELLNKKEKIKLRIIMLTECVYNCRCCHHENITEVFAECQVEEVKKSLEVLKKNFDIQQITITGGEPLLPANRENLLQILRYIRSNWKTIDLSIITNAHFLDSRCIKELKYFNVRYKISLYGYDEKSFREYTRFDGSLNNGMKYITDIKNKIKMLYQNSCNITLNIPLNSKISVGLKDFLFSSRFREMVINYGIEVKIIEMVRPRRGDKFFEEDYVQVSPVINKIRTDEHEGKEEETFFTTQRYNMDGINVTFYKYPCGNSENCQKCFNNFALTVKPDGKMLICHRALMYKKIAKEKLFKAGIELEDVDLGKEYDNK